MIYFLQGGPVKLSSKKLLSLIGAAILLVTFLAVPNAKATSGCCSWHGGVAGCSTSGRQVCNDGTLSPSCTCYSPPPTPMITYGYDYKKETIPFSVETQDDPNSFKGQTNVSQKGVNGEKTITYKVTYSNKVETKRVQTKEEITKQPTDEITLIGNKEKPVEQPTAIQTDQPKKSWLSSFLDWLKRLLI